MRAGQPRQQSAQQRGGVADARDRDAERLGSFGLFADDADIEPETGAAVEQRLAAAPQEGDIDDRREAGDQSAPMSQPSSRAHGQLHFRQADDAVAEDRSAGAEDRLQQRDRHAAGKDVQRQPDDHLVGPEGRRREPRKRRRSTSAAATPQATPNEGGPVQIEPMTAKKAPTSIWPSRPMLKMPALVVNEPPSATSRIGVVVRRSRRSARR